MQIAPEIMAVYDHLLQDKKLDMALRAELLTPPGFEEVIAGLKSVDVTAVEDARDAYQKALGQGLQQAFNAFYQELWARKHTS